MISLNFNIGPQFCNKCGAKCYLTLKEDGYEGGEMTYQIMKNCPHAGFFNFESHSQGALVDWGQVEE